jgi:hypothetical protein
VSLDPRSLVSCLDQPLARLLAPGDRETLRAHLALATRAASPGGDLIVAAHGAVGRILPHGSAVLYRPESAAPLRHRLLEVDAGGKVTGACDRNPRGALRAAWVRLGSDEAIGLVPGGADHPLWGPSDRIVRAAGEPNPPTLLTIAGAANWSLVDAIPPVAEPARLPPGGGAALLNVLAAIARDQDRPSLRYRGPYPTEQLFWSLTESFHFARGQAGGEVVARFVEDAEATFAHGAAREAPVDWIPAPHERRLHGDGLLAHLRDGVERVAWQGRSYHRTDCQGLRRREHRVVRLVDGAGGSRRWVASLCALGRVVEDHLALDERGEVLDRYAPAADTGVDTPLAAPWREALAALLPLEATPLLTGAIERVWPELTLVWGPVPGDLVEARRGPLRVSSKLPDLYHVARAGTPAAGRRALARDLVREVLGLVAPATRDAAARWLAALTPARQDAELAAAARRDRVTLAQAALAPLRRLLDALEAGETLPA